MPFRDNCGEGQSFLAPASYSMFSGFCLPKRSKFLRSDMLATRREEEKNTELENPRLPRPRTARQPKKEPLKRDSLGRG